MSDSCKNNDTVQSKLDDTLSHSFLSPSFSSEDVSCRKSKEIKSGHLPCISDFAYPSALLSDIMVCNDLPYSMICL